jgi:hypothetical protein
VLEVLLHRVDEDQEHVVGLALDGVVDVLLPYAVPFGPTLKDLAQLGLGPALIGLKLLQAVPRIGTALEGMGPVYRQGKLAAHQCTIGRWASTRARSSATSPAMSSYCLACATASTAR